MIRRVENFPAHLSASSIERLDLDGQGRRVLTLAGSAGPVGGPQWWVETAGGWTPTGPEEDRELPFAAALPEALARPGARLLAWKPARRLVLLSGAPGTRTVLKAHRRSGFPKALAAHRAAQQALARGTWRAAPLSAGLNADPEACVLEMDFVDGSALELLEQASDVHFRIGAGLRDLQEAVFEAELAPHRAEDELAVVARLTRRAEACGAELPGNFEETDARLSAQRECFDEGELLPCHRDLHDGQFLKTRERLVCLDFDLLCRADSALDAANFVVHLQLRALQAQGGARGSDALALARAFLEGLDRQGERGFDARFCWYQAASFLRLAAVHAMRPRWLHLAPELVNLSRRCLEDLDRA